MGDAGFPPSNASQGEHPMKAVSKVLLGTVIAFGLAAAPLVQASEPDALIFAKKLDENKDGMVSKAEFMKAMEKMYDKMDTEKKGMIDQKAAMKLWDDIHHMGSGA
jgi:hypothetical protein